MLNPFKTIFSEFNRRSSKKLLQRLSDIFPTAKNVEWTHTNGTDEAIFYIDDQEVIARFGKNSELIDYKLNLDINTIPAVVRNAAEQHGEIMNAISINTTKGIDGYEIIFRDNKLTRFTMVTSAEGTILGIQLL
jgi:hypothetical protein